MHKKATAIAKKGTMVGVYIFMASGAGISWGGCWGHEWMRGGVWSVKYEGWELVRIIDSYLMKPNSKGRAGMNIKKLDVNWEYEILKLSTSFKFQLVIC